MALKRYSSLVDFGKSAVEEYSIISKQMAQYIDNNSTLPFIPFVEHIHFNILVQRASDNNDYKDEFIHPNAMWPISIKIRSFADKYQTIQYVILPELFTEYIMEKEGMNYKEASRYLYGGKLPTTHHVNMLLSDVVINALHFNGVTLQVVEGNLANQYTHAIVNFTDQDLLHSDKTPASIAEVGGISIHNSCTKYTNTHGPMSVGEVASLSAGNLHCYFLFHVVLAAPGKMTPQEKDIETAMASILSLASLNECISVAIPALEYPQNICSMIINVLAKLLQATDYSPIKLIRIVSLSKSLLNFYGTAL